MSELVILMIEDDPVDVLMVQKTLASMEIQTRLITTDNCMTALDRLSGDLAEQNLIILLDINIPQMDGLEFLSELRKEPDNAVIPVIIMTTSEDVYDVQACYQVGISGYMVKPFEFEEFKGLIDAIIHYWTYSLLPHRKRFDPGLRYKRKKGANQSEDTLYRG